MYFGKSKNWTWSVQFGAYKNNFQSLAIPAKCLSCIECEVNELLFYGIENKYTIKFLENTKS